MLTQQLTLVHLSFFDGIGAASLALRALDIHPVLTISWETDPECIHIIEEHCQPIHMGDINDFDIEKLIDTLLDNLDPDVPITILITGGPPCPDFSGIRANPNSTAGATGHLFQKFVQIIQQPPTDTCPRAHREHRTSHQRTTRHCRPIRTTWHRPHHRGRRGRRHYPSQTTLVVVSNVGQSQDATGCQHPMGPPVVRNRHTVATPPQPHRTNTATHT